MDFFATVSLRFSFPLHFSVLDYEKPDESAVTFYLCTKKGVYGQLSSGGGARQIVRRPGAFRKFVAGSRRRATYRTDCEERDGQNDSAQHHCRARGLRGGADHVSPGSESGLSGTKSRVSRRNDRAGRLFPGRFARVARRCRLRTGGGVGRRRRFAPGDGRNGRAGCLELRIAGQADPHAVEN